MSEYMFGCFNGHLSAGLVKKIETKFRHVTVHNYTEPRGEKRGWFAGPNRGSPFDGAMAREVLSYARSVAKGRDRDVLSCNKRDS